jgi:radical SAM protein with 4Fe4S-binding SPASM domain
MESKMNFQHQSSVIHGMDVKNRFMFWFDRKTGKYIRTGVLEEVDGKIVDTDVDPFMTDYPQLIDVGIMGHCIHGKKGLCSKAGVQCYQNGLNHHCDNMSVEDFKSICMQSAGKTLQIALGGRGDPNKHENFAEILDLCETFGIVPNYTTSGLDLTDNEVELTKTHCGAVAVSFYRSDYTLNALRKFINAGVKTNIHYVLSKTTIDEAIHNLQNNKYFLDEDFAKDINAVIFLLHKPVGLGQRNQMLDMNDERVKTFFSLIDMKQNFKIGFDSCTVPGILNHCKEISRDSLDTCEGGRWSCYIDSDMNMLPCSFDNQDKKWGVSLRDHSIAEAWHSDMFDDFRGHFRKSCSGCKDRRECMGGCPIVNDIVLCNRKERD